MRVCFYWCNAIISRKRGIILIVEIVTTGSELLLGQIINTNSVYMAAELNKLGFDVVYPTEQDS